MISVKPNFLSTEEISTVLNYIENEAPLGWHTIPDDENKRPDDSFWDNRILDVNRLDIDNPKEKTVIELLVNLRKRIIKHIIETQGFTEPIYGDSLFIVRWFEGDYQIVHADGEYDPDSEYVTPGEEYPFPHRIYSSLCFLNNDFDGGEIYFPKKDIEIKPEPGTMVAYPGTHDYSHSFGTVNNGIKYTIVSYYTKDKDKTDRWPE